MLLSVLLIVSVLLILTIESPKTEVESAVNRIPTEQHTLSSRVKDARSVEVLMASINLVVLWG